MYQIREISNHHEWDSFLEKTPTALFPFFQTWEWGEVQQRLGYSVVRWGMYAQDLLLALFQVIEIKAKRGHYLHVRHGPVFEEVSKEQFSFLVSFLKQQAKEKQASFIRMSPLFMPSPQTKQLFTREGFLPSPMHNMDAEICWELDIQKEEQELLLQMRKTHRYLIKKAQGMGVTITQTTTPADFSSFLPLYQSLSQRKGFVPHKGVQEEFEIFAQHNEAALFFASYEGNIIAGALIAFVGDIAIYRHGATDTAYRDIPASYLLQWEAIREAKKRNKKYYNFWGIAPTDDPKHPWYGLSLFKKGFGGYQKEFMHAHDLPVSIKYWPTYLFERLMLLVKGK